MMFAVCAPATARIEKTAIPCKTGICLYWWPAMAYVKGWHHDQGASLMYSINAEAPDGYTFSNAESVIYAKAVYKPRQPETKSLQMFINGDKASILARDHTIEISEVKPLTTEDGRNLPSYTFFPAKKGNWEEASYSEEGEYYLVFVLSSRSKEGFKKALGAYKKFIVNYR